MVNTLLIIISYIIIGSFGIFRLLQNNKKKLIIYLFFLSISLTISILLSLEINIPSPAKPIEKIVKLIIER